MLNNKLDSAQLGAVFHNLGPALVVAGPGSGKTTVILNRVMYLIQQYQVSPEQILVLTFTKAAAQSLQNRFGNMTMGEILPVSFGTFHSIFYQILRQYGSYKNSKIITTKEKYSLLFDLGVKDKSLLGDICYAFGYLLNNPDGMVQNVLPGQMSEGEFQRLFSSYLRQLQMEDLLDFDQMAELTLKLLKEKPFVLKRLQEQYRYILVDEFQDTNLFQYEFLRLLTSNRKELFVVGDDDQAIYSFRGSFPSIMKLFQEDYIEAKSYYLTMNYRSYKQIVIDANRLIALNQNRVPKKMHAYIEELGTVRYLAFETKELEYTYVAQRIKQLSERMNMTQIAVIGRTNRQIEQLVSVFSREGIPFQTNAEVCTNPYSAMTEHLIGLIEYILGEKSKARFWRSINGYMEGKEASFWMDKHAKLFMNYLTNNKTYMKYLETIVEDKSKMEKELSILLKESGRHKTLGSFLTTLRNLVQGKEPQSEGVHLLTMHGSKGLEFEYVCLVDISEGVIPSKQCITKCEIEEERRMLYVGMTRAKKILDVCYLKGTKEHPRLASRFLNPLLGREPSENQSSTISSNSALSRNSSKASATASYSSSSSI